MPEIPWNKGLSGILCFDENSSATLLQHVSENAQKGMVANGCLVRKEKHMNKTFEKNKEPRTSLQGFLSEFRDALEEEIYKIEKSGQSSTLLFGG